MPRRRGATVLVCLMVLAMLGSVVWVFDGTAKSAARALRSAVSDSSRPEPLGPLRAEPTAVPGADAGTRMPQRPNVVYVMTDDMRYDDLRYAPNVRRYLAEGGTQFMNSFANYPLCCPARASFFTGQYAHNHHVYSHEEPYGFGSFDDRRTLATSLKAAGYRTGFIGKYLNGYGAMPSRVTGESSYDYVPAGWDDWYGAVERPSDDKPEGGTYDYFRTVYNINGTPSGTRFHGEYQTHTMGRFARRLITKYAKRDKPWFLYTAFVAPHHGAPFEDDDPEPVERSDGEPQGFDTAARPGWVKGRFDDQITDAPGVTPQGRTESDISDKPSYLRRPEINASERIALRDAARQRAEAVFVMDREFGRMMRTLKHTGQADDTIVVFTSDNGYFQGEHRIRQGKITAHEPSLRIPLLMAGPGVPKGERRFAPTATVDQAATVLDITGAGAPHQADGHSFVDLLARDTDWDRAVIDEAMLVRMPRLVDGFEDARTSIGLRTARWSYIRYASGRGELYDLFSDPNQLRNRYRDPGLADVRADLERVWWRVKDCKGERRCQPRLPATLRVPATELATRYHRWEHEVQARRRGVEAPGRDGAGSGDRRNGASRSGR